MFGQSLCYMHCFHFSETLILQNNQRKEKSRHDVQKNPHKITMYLSTIEEVE